MINVSEQPANDFNEPLGHEMAQRRPNACCTLAGG